MKMKKSFLLIISALPLLGSCDLFNKINSTDNESYQYSGFADVEGGNLVTDDGFTFIVTTDNSDKKWTSSERIFYFIENISSVTTTAYSATLADYYDVEVMPLETTAQRDTSNLCKDPVRPINNGISLTGTRTTGNLNLILCYFAESTSSTVHDFWAIKDETLSDDEKVCIKLFHDSKGDVYSEGKTASNFEARYKLISVPLSRVIPSTAEASFNININYVWHTGSTIESDTSNMTSENEISLSE